MSVLRVPKNRLVLVAGLLWCTAGAMVTIVGLPLELGLAPSHLVLIPLAIGIFLAFYLAVFSRLVHAHTRRIRARPEDRLPIWNVFNPPSWGIMAVMMSGGFALRVSRVMPDWAIAFFYSGLGLALFVCGLRLVRAFTLERVPAEAPGTTS